MIPKVKICGLRDAAAARLAADCGADLLGFITFPRSPSHLEPEVFRTFAGDLPPVPKVSVRVRPSLEELLADRDDFDFFQIHFPLETPEEEIAAWSKILTPAALWLAPKLPPGVPFPEHLLSLAETIFIDTYRPDKYGGTGETGDWKRFAALRERWPEKRWILAGGLNPDNVASAVRATGASWIDLKSGVESETGVKDPAKLRALFANLRNG